MKRILISSFSVLVVSMMGATGTQARNVETTPFNLLGLAYNGYFQEQGIPSFNAFQTAIKSGQVTAEDLVRAAVQQNRLSSEHLNDTRYIRSIKRLLNDIDRD